MRQMKQLLKLYVAGYISIIDSTAIYFCSVYSAIIVMNTHFNNTIV